MNDDDRRRAEAFVRDVESAMTGAPAARRTELTDGLVDHLLEPGEDGHRLIDEHLDPESYAAELLGASPANAPTGTGRRTPYLAGAAVLALVVAVGAWVGIAGPWHGTTPQGAATPTTPTSTGPAQVYVPDLRGLDRTEAVADLAAVGLTAQVLTLDEGQPGPWVSSLPGGTVAEQDPSDGTPVDEGSAVVLMVTP